MIDVTLVEFDRRFTENNDILLALFKSAEMELVDLQPLEKLGLKLPPEYELKTTKKYVETKRLDWEKERELAENQQQEQDENTGHKKKKSQSLRIPSHPPRYGPGWIIA